jgi:large subunit ribosomal protein L16
MIFELDGVPETLARECLRLAATKLPIRSRFVMRHEG